MEYQLDMSITGITRIGESAQKQWYARHKIKPSTMEGFLVTQGISSVIPLLHHHNYIVPPKGVGVNFSFLKILKKTNQNILYATFNLIGL